MTAGLRLVTARGGDKRPSRFENSPVCSDAPECLPTPTPTSSPPDQWETRPHGGESSHKPCPSAVSLAPLKKFLQELGKDLSVASGLALTLEELNEGWRDGNV